jgi:hypothetical protein
VHFNPAGSEQASADIKEFEEDVPVQLVQQARMVVRESEDGTAIEERRALAEFDEEPNDDERDDEREDETDVPAPAGAVREGLPSRFRMRHTPHYVDELLGEAPLRTVREIPLSEIELPTEDRA